jgi:hypothetical protein
MWLAGWHIPKLPSLYYYIHGSPLLTHRLGSSGEHTATTGPKKEFNMGALDARSMHGLQPCERKAFLQQQQQQHSPSITALATAGHTARNYTVHS